MKQRDLKYSCLIAVLYFGMNVNAQTAPKDTAVKEQKIEEVVLIGYGGQKKLNITGSIGTVSAKDLADRPNSNPMSSIQGKVSGVNIVNPGAPGVSPRVDIRGISSLNGATVFIVDGIITTDISYLNPLDIESMSILKDPSSLAIYGSRATNGAVIIKTKGGKGKTSFNFNSYLGVKTVPNVVDMVNKDQYIELYNEKLKYSGATSGFLNPNNYGTSTDWFKEILKPSIINSNDISASGSTDKINYFLSLGYLTDQGNLDAGQGINSGNDFKRFTSRINVTYKLTDKLTVGTNSSWSQMSRNNAVNPLLTAYSSPPIYDPINPDGSYGYQTLTSLANPRAQLDLTRDRNKENRYIINLWGEYKILKDLVFKTNFTQDNGDTSGFIFTNPSSYLPGNIDKSKLSKFTSNARNYVFDNTLTWTKNLGAHHLVGLIGTSAQEAKAYKLTGKAEGVKYSGDDGSLFLINGGTNMTVEETEVKTSRLWGYFARINYDYAGKYLLNASIRRDASNNFSEGDRSRWFPAVGLGWVVSKENFLADQNILSLLKLKASWAKMGNPDVPRSYDNRAIKIGGAYFGNTGIDGYSTTDIYDLNIGWETIEGKDAGVELGFFNNKLTLEANYYRKDSRDVVYPITQPAISGASNKLTTNAFSFYNKGFEFNLAYNTNITDKIKFGVYGNLTTLDNQITSVYNNSFNETGPYLFGNTITRLEKGQAVGSFYGYNVVGVFQNQAQVNSAPTYSSVKKQVGGFMFEDRDGNGVIDSRDKTFLGSPIPDYTYGFGFNLSGYNFDFAIDFQGVQGNKIYNYNREQRYGNESWDLDMYKNRWHGEGTSNTNSAISTDQQIIVPSSFYVEDGSFFRVRNILLGYTLGSDFTKSLNIQKLRVYISAQNPWTSFKYNGFSPEILNSDRVQMGVDNNITPISAIYTLGLNLTF